MEMCGLGEYITNVIERGMLQDDGGTYQDEPV